MGLETQSGICLDSSGNVHDGFVSSPRANCYQASVAGWAGLIAEVIHGTRSPKCLPELSAKTLRPWVCSVVAHPELLSGEDLNLINSVPVPDREKCARLALEILLDNYEAVQITAKRLAHQAHLERKEILSGTTNEPGQPRIESRRHMNNEIHREVTDDEVRRLNELYRGYESRRLISLCATPEFEADRFLPPASPPQVEARTEADPWNLLSGGHRLEAKREDGLRFEIQAGRHGGTLRVYDREGFLVDNPDLAALTAAS
jgi:hypothetical protein